MFSPILEYSLARPAQTDRVAPVRGRKVRLVATAGCLVEETGGGWLLTRVGHLENTTVQSTSTAERSALAKLPSGSLSVRLIGERPFNPVGHAGQRVAAKGALIKDANGIRLNVTSLQTVGQACAR